MKRGFLLATVWFCMLLSGRSADTLNKADTSSIVFSEMAPFYLPNQSYLVTIVVRPSTNIVVYAVEDQPPQVWKVISIDQDGFWDSRSKKVKWGPYFDNQPRSFSYTVISPSDASGQVFFSGLASLDGNNIPISGSRTATIKPENTAPILSSVADQLVHEGNTLVITNIAVDTDIPKNTLTFELLAGPGGAHLDPLTGILRWTPTEDQGPSTNLIVIKVSDNQSPALAATNSYKVVVNEVNTSPVLLPIGDHTLNVGDSLAITIQATDVDLPTNKLTFILAFGPDGASINSEAGVLTWTPSVNYAGTTNYFKVLVTDDGIPVLYDQKTFAVNVNRTVPVFVAVPDQSIAEGSMMTVTNLIAASGTTSNLTFELLAGPGGAHLDPLTGILRWTPTEDQGPSTNLIVIKVSDNQSPALAATNSYKVVVNEVNTAPVLLPIGDHTLNVGESLAITIQATDADLPTNKLTFILAFGPDGASINPETGVLTWTPSVNYAGTTNYFKVLVTDDGIPVLYDQKTFAVNVNRTIPVFVAVPDQSIAEGSMMTVTNLIAASGTTSSNLTFELLSGPGGGAHLDPLTGILKWTPTEDQGPSTNLIVIKVSDNQSPALAATNSYKVVVNEVNIAPVLLPIGDHTLNVGESLAITIQATDADLPTNKLTFILAFGPEGASINPETGVLTWTPSVNYAGTTNYFKVLVTDDGIPVLYDQKTFAVNVNRTVPVFVAVPDQSIAEGSMTTVTNLIAASGTTSSNLTFELLAGPGGAHLDPLTGILRWTPTEDQGPSTNLIVIKVSDNQSPALAATNSYKVVVNEVNTAPVLLPIGDHTLNVGESLAITIQATDADLPTNKLTFILAFGPDGASINPETGVLTWTPSVNYAGTTNYFKVLAMDNGIPLLYDQQVFNVVVKTTSIKIALQSSNNINGIFNDEQDAVVDELSETITVALNGNRCFYRLKSNVNYRITGISLNNGHIVLRYSHP